MSDKIIRNGGELHELLFAGTYNNEISRIRSPYLFRGVNNAAFDLYSSLMRLNHDHADVERPLFRNFRKYALSALDSQPTFWEVLTMAQHHGLPTRLLDWTYSPLVALHFATNETDLFNLDGAVWKVHVNKAHARLPEKYRGPLLHSRTEVFTTELLDELIPSWEALTELERAAEDYAFFFEPPSLDARIVNQYAALSLLTDPQKSLSTWLDDNSVEYIKIIIPAAIKKEIRDKLDLANITERVMFPGLDGIGAWLKRYYMNL